MTEHEQLQRIASLPAETTLWFDMSHLSKERWVWYVAWTDEDKRKRRLYLGRDTWGYVAALAKRYPPARPYRMETGRRRLERRGAFVR